jgi:hypothetical protein
MKIWVSPVWGWRSRPFAACGDVFQCADGGGAYGYDSSAFGAGAVEGFGCFGGERVAFAVELDFGEFFYAQRGEGAQAYVEGDFGDFYASCGDFGEDFRGEVEAGGGGGYGAFLVGEDGLVAFAVGVGVVALDVGRQGDVADLSRAA